MNLLEQLAALIEAQDADGLLRFAEDLHGYLICERERDVLRRIAEGAADMIYRLEELA